MNKLGFGFGLFCAVLSGWYMAVEAEPGEVNSFAALRSPTMNQSSADCTLHFYYHMYGQGMDASPCVCVLPCKTQAGTNKCS